MRAAVLSLLSGSVGLVLAGAVAARAAVPDIGSGGPLGPAVASLPRPLLDGAPAQLPTPPGGPPPGLPTPPGVSPATATAGGPLPAASPPAGVPTPSGGGPPGAPPPPPGGTLAPPSLPALPTPQLPSLPTLSGTLPSIDSLASAIAGR